MAYLLPDAGIPVGGTKGASVHVTEICQAFAANGAQVTLLAQTVAGAPPAGVDLLQLDPGPLPAGPSGEEARAEAVAEFFARAADALSADPPDVICERLSLFAAGGGTLARRLNAGRIVEVNAPVAEERARYAELRLADLAHEAERRALAGAHAVTVSEPLANWALRQGAARATTVPNGVDTLRFRPRSRSEVRRVRARLGLEDTDEVVAFVGSLKPWHGIDVLLKAVEAVAARRPLVRLLTVGDGPMGPDVDAAARGPLAGRIVRAGAVLPERVPELLAAADVATAPYRGREEFYFSPLKVAEAMAAGVPVVASSLGPIAAMLAGTGILVPPDDPDALAGALEQALADPVGRAGRAAAARAHAVARHDWRSVARRVLTEVRVAQAASGAVRQEAG